MIALLISPVGTILAALSLFVFFAALLFLLLRTNSRKGGPSRGSMEVFTCQNREMVHIPFL